MPATPDLIPARPTADARVITLRDGTRWLVTVVARLVSEDVAAGTESARLIVRLECLSQPLRTARVTTLRARGLHAVSDDALSAEIARRSRPTQQRREGGGGSTARG